MQTPTVRREEIADGLESLGLKSGGVVLVHSSLSSFGRVEGGADAVLDALRDVLGASGNIVAPALTYEWFLAAKDTIDLREAPSETGLIPETLRRRPGTFRSRHPLSSAVAAGPDAEELTSRHHDSPCDLESPYGKVYQRSGQVLFLGVGFETNSLFHVAEELRRPDFLGFQTFPGVRVLCADGQLVEGDFRKYLRRGPEGKRRLGMMEPLYRAAGVLREKRIGRCQAVLAEARDIVKIAGEVIMERIETLLPTPAELDT